MIYQFKKEAKIGVKGLNAQTAGEELERIRIQNGGKLRPEDILNEASSKDSPLHPVFEWDDSRAARKYRIQQARRFLKAIVVVYEDNEVAPAFYNVSVNIEDDEGNEETERFYQSAEVLVKRPDQFESARSILVGTLADAQTSLERLMKIAPDNHRQRVHRASHFVGEAHKSLVETAV